MVGVEDKTGNSDYTVDESTSTPTGIDGSGTGTGTDSCAGNFDGTNLSPISIRSTEPRDKFPVFDDGNSLLGVIVDRSSFDDDDELTTYGGRDISSNNPSSSSSVAIDLYSIREQQLHNQQQHLIDMNIPDRVGVGYSSGGIVMRNGKVRRKLRWKPRFGKKKSDGGDLSSNASVVSALTNRSNSTSRSSSTTRSFLSHFSKRSNNSFHTFHSTETPVATNKANRPQAPHTVMRPNYQDSFDHRPHIAKNKNAGNNKHSTIDTEGKHILQQQNIHQRRESFRSNLDSVQELSSSPTEEIDGGESEHQVDENYNVADNIVPNPLKFSTVALSTSQNTNCKIENISGHENNNELRSATVSKEQKQKQKQKQKQQQQQNRTRRPPLFKRRMRHFKNGSSSISNNKSSTERTCSSPTDTNSTSSSSLSPSLSLERENSVIPMSLGEEYEEDRRVLINTTETSTIDSTTQGGRSSSRMPRNIVTVTTTTRSPSNLENRQHEKITSEFVGSVGGDVLLEEGIEETSVSPSLYAGDNQSIQSASINGGSNGQSSIHSASSNTVSGLKPTSTSLKRSDPSITKKQSASSSSVSTASPKSGTSRGDVGSLMSPDGLIKKNHRKTISTNDAEEGVHAEAEHNLRAINEMAAEHMAHGEYEEAADVFEEILRGQQERYGQDHYRVGTALHNLGIVYLKLGDYKRAIEICQRAVAVRKDSLVPNHPDVAVSLAQLGVAHLESQNFRKALAAFRDALHIRRNFLGRRHPKCSKILNNIGCALYSINDFGASKRAFDEALDIQRDALRSIPSTESTESTHLQSNALLLSMASTLCNIGSIKVRWSEFDEAIIDLEEALLIQQSVLGDNHPTVLSTSDSIDLVDTAKSSSANNQSSAHEFYMNKAVTICSDTETNPTTIVTELFGIENLDTITSINWLQNPCGSGSASNISA